MLKSSTTFHNLVLTFEKKASDYISIVMLHVRIEYVISTVIVISTVTQIVFDKISISMNIWYQLKYDFFF